MTQVQTETAEERLVHVQAGIATLTGDLVVPEGASGVVLFAHGSGSSRLSPRNRAVGRRLSDRGLATLLIDLLTPEEERVDIETAHLRFDIGLLADRLAGAKDWLAEQPATRDLRIGYFGASTGAAAALHPKSIGAVVSRGGRPDLAGNLLPRVQAPTLLIVGGEDLAVIEMNRDAFAQLTCRKKLEIVPGATHLFEEPGALETVGRLAGDWLVEHLAPPKR